MVDQGLDARLKKKVRLVQPDFFPLALLGTQKVFPWSRADLGRAGIAGAIHGDSEPFFIVVFRQVRGKNHAVAQGVKLGDKDVPAPPFPARRFEVVGKSVGEVPRVTEAQRFESTAIPKP
jgi:hypothetical protein